MNVDFVMISCKLSMSASPTHARLAPLTAGPLDYEWRQGLQDPSKDSRMLSDQSRTLFHMRNELAMLPSCSAPLLLKFLGSVLCLL
jgi:hypothetical protein